MRFLVRWAFRLIVLLVILAVSLALLKDTLLKSLVEHRMRSQTGLETRIGKFEADLFNPTMTIQDLVLYNSAGFGGSPFIKLAELHVEYDSHALAFGEMHFKLLRFDLEEVNVVQDQAGRNNLQALHESLKAKAARNNEIAPKFTGIDMLNLSIGKLTFLDLSKPNELHEINIGIRHEIVQNVKSITDLSGLVIRLLVKKAKDLLPEDI